MTLDLALLAAVALFALAGYFSGAVRQLSHWVGLAAAYLLSKPAAAYLGPLAATRMDWPAAPTTVALGFVAMPVILLAASMSSRFVLNMLEPGEERGPLDQGVGAVVGGAKGAAILYALLCLAASLEKPLASMHFDLAAKTQGSATMAFAQGHNLFAKKDLSALDSLKKLADARSDPKAAADFLKGDAVKSLLGNPALKSVLGNQALQNALKSGDSSRLLADPAVKKLLEDPELLKKLDQF